MALLVLGIIYLRHGKFDKDTAIDILLAYGVGAVFYFLWRAARTVVAVDNDREADYRSVATKLARVSQQLEDEQRKRGILPKPEIEVRVKEFLAIPEPGRANCFILLYLHNSSSDTEVTLPEYKITLEIAGKTYSSSQLLNTFDFQAVNYVEDYDEESNREPELVISVRDEMSDLRSIITDELPLVRGKFKQGWLAFSVSPVPSWPIHNNVVNRRIEYDEDGEPYEDEDIEIVLLDTSLTVFQVSVMAQR